MGPASNHSKMAELCVEINFVSSYFLFLACFFVFGHRFICCANGRRLRCYRFRCHSVRLLLALSLHTCMPVPSAVRCKLLFLYGQENRRKATRRSARLYGMSTWGKTAGPPYSASKKGKGKNAFYAVVMYRIEANLMETAVRRKEWSCVRGTFVWGV